MAETENVLVRDAEQTTKVWICYYHFFDDTEVEGIATTEAIAKNWLAVRQEAITSGKLKQDWHRFDYEEVETDAFRYNEV